MGADQIGEDDLHRRVAAARKRALGRLTDEERQRVGGFLGKDASDRTPPFAVLRTAYERMLFALGAVNAPLSPNELVYLLLARWDSNTDAWSVRRRLALAVQQDEAHSVQGGRYLIASAGIGHLDAVERAWMRQAARDAVRQQRRSPDRRQAASQGARPRTPESRPRPRVVVSRGRSAPARSPAGPLQNRRRKRA